MKSINYILLLSCAVLVGLYGHAERQVEPKDAPKMHQPERKEAPALHKKEGGELKQHASGRVPSAAKMDKRADSRTGESMVRGSRDSHRGGKVDHERGHRVDRHTFGDHRRGRQWYQSFRNRFWATDFYWPRAMVFTTFFTGLIPQLDTLDIPDEQYQALVLEIQELQSLLSQQRQDSALSVVIRHRLSDLIGKLVELVPGLDVQGLFESGR